MIAVRSTIAAFALVLTAVSVCAATATTRYFIVAPGSGVPLAIAAFSSDARADVGVFSNGPETERRPARGKFSVGSDGAPFRTGQTLETLVVVAQTPRKTIAFTFTGVTIDAAEPTNAKNDRVTFEATNYAIKYSDRKSP